MAGGFAGFANDPMYQWLRDQGTQSVTRQMAATGRSGSGAEMIALQQQGFGLAQDYFNDQYKRLAELSGASSNRMQRMQTGDLSGDIRSASQGTAEAFTTSIGALSRLFSSNGSSSTSNPNTTPTGQPVYGSNNMSVDPNSGYGGFLSSMRGGM